MPRHIEPSHVEEKDTARVKRTGAWEITDCPGCIGKDALISAKPASSALRVTPGFPVRGKYEVFMRWKPDKTRSRQVPVFIKHVGGTKEVRVNQRVGGYPWKSLGTFEFEKNGSVVRRMVGYDRYQGMKAWEALAALYGVLRKYVNFFQPSLKLLTK